MLIWFPPGPDRELGVWLWLIVRTGMAAGISAALSFALLDWMGWRLRRGHLLARAARSEEHTSELQSLMRNSYAVFCLKKKKKQHQTRESHMNKYNIDTR